MRSFLPLVSVLAAGCVFPAYKASKVVELTLPVEKLQELACESHNGAITVTGDAAATDISLRAELSVRGYTQSEANSNLELLEVGREENGGTLRIFGKYPSGTLDNLSPGFTFTLKVPQRFAVRLVSHNGDITANDIDGAATIETHNGDIGGALRGRRVSATTHNGNVGLRLSCEGALDGEARSHNGDIDLAIAESAGTRLEATTQNGRITPPAKLADATIGKSSLACRLGDGKGRFVIDTHNGNVVIR
jgi:DUF4097 and DUF4098 domain-containing protein YvlB